MLCLVNKLSTGISTTTDMCFSNNLKTDKKILKFVLFTFIRSYSMQINKTFNKFQRVQINVHTICKYVFTT